MAKFYFLRHNEDVCYQIGYWKEYMADNELKEIELYEAKRETGSGHFFCKEFQEIGDVGEGCGRFCDKYKPNNGKNGRCKHYGYCYEPTDKKIILKLKDNDSKN